MGFNKRYLPELEELKKTHERFSDDKEFIKFIVGKSEALIGPSDSIQYLDEIYEKTKRRVYDEVG